MENMDSVNNGPKKSFSVMVVVAVVVSEKFLKRYASAPTFVLQGANCEVASHCARLKGSI